MPIVLSSDDFYQLLHAAHKAKVDNIHGHSYYELNKFRQCIDEIKILDAGWNSEYDSYKKKPNLMSEQTYQECISWTGTLKEDHIEITMQMWNGDSLNGYREDKRCWWKFNITDKHLVLFDSLIKPKIVQRLQEAATERFEEQKAAEELAKINKIYQEFFE